MKSNNNNDNNNNNNNNKSCIVFRKIAAFLSVLTDYATTPLSRHNRITLSNLFFTVENNSTINQLCLQDLDLVRAKSRELAEENVGLRVLTCNGLSKTSQGMTRQANYDASRTQSTVSSTVKLSAQLK